MVLSYTILPEAMLCSTICLAYFGITLWTASICLAVRNFFFEVLLGQRRTELCVILSEPTPVLEHGALVFPLGFIRVLVDSQKGTDGLFRVGLNLLFEGIYYSFLLLNCAISYSVSTESLSISDCAVSC